MNFDPSLIGKCCKVLIDINMIIDMDFGVLNLIRSDYLDKDVFDVEWFHNNSKIRDMVLSLYTRESINPLDLCCKNIILQSVKDDLYNEIISTKKEEVLKVSMLTELYKVLQSYKISGDVSVGIMYTDDEELKVLKELPNTKSLPKYSIFELSSDSKLVNSYNQFMVKDINSDYIELLSDSIVFDKTIYIGNYSFNIDKKNKSLIPTKNILNLIKMRNILRIIDLYNMTELVSEKEYNNEGN